MECHFGTNGVIHGINGEPKINQIYVTRKIQNKFHLQSQFTLKIKVRWNDFKILRKKR